MKTLHEAARSANFALTTLLMLQAHNWKPDAATEIARIQKDLEDALKRDAAKQPD